MTSLLRLCSVRFVWRRGPGIVDERATETADTEWEGIRRNRRENPAMLLVQHKMLPLPGGCFALWLACYFPLVILLELVFTRFR